MVRILGGLAHERGKSNEARVLEACLLPTRPAWMKSARRATTAEDHDGIDVVVESDLGKLYVQVKSSRRGQAEFQKKKRRIRVVVVRPSPADTPEQILRRVFGPLGALRAELLRERAQGCSAAPSRAVAREPRDRRASRSLERSFPGGDRPTNSSSTSRENTATTVFPGRRIVSRLSR